MAIRGPLQKFQKKKKKNEGKGTYDVPTKAPMGALLSSSFVASLLSTSVIMASVAVGTGGHLGFIKHSSKRGLEESSMLSGISG